MIPQVLLHDRDVGYSPQSLNDVRRLFSLIIRSFPPLEAAIVSFSSPSISSLSTAAGELLVNLVILLATGPPALYLLTTLS